MILAAACHIHSDWSYDGRWSLEQLAAEFARRNYRVLLMTEHDRGFTPERLELYREACARASSAQVLVVPGIEYSDPENKVHILTWGSVPFAGENLSTLSLLRAVHAAKGLAVLAHPSRKEAWKCYDPAWSEYLHGIEVWNRKTDGWAPSENARTLNKRAGKLAMVGMDFHTPKQMFPLTMELDIDADINESAVLDALYSGRCRALAFGLPLEKSAAGCLGATLRSMEYFRKTAATTYRAWRKPHLA